MASQDDDEQDQLQSAELRKQSEWLRVTLASIGDAVISTDVQGLVTFMNGIAETLTGWSYDEAAGRPLLDVFRIVNEQTRQPVENPALRALREGRVVGLANHTVLIARDGSELPIDDSAAPMRNESDAIIGAVLVFRDVTERKRAEEARALLAAIVESSHDAIISKSLDGTIRSWNAAAERLFGYSAKEAVGQPITLIIPADRQHEEQAIINRLIKGERIEQLETVRITKSGQLRDISLSISPLCNSEGQVIGASKIARDITVQKRTEQERRRLKQEIERRRRLYETILSSTPDFVYVFSLDHRVVYANDSLLTMWGRRWEDAIGKTLLEIGYEPWHDAMHRREIDEVRETRAPIRGEVPFNGAYGHRIYEYIFVPVLGEDGEVEAVAGTTRDITDRQQMEEALRETDRNKDEFIALLAHELRNPLAPLRNGLEVMRLSQGDTSMIAEAREIMERQLAHMVRLIDDLLDISRLSQNKMELRPTRVRLSEIVQNAVEAARSTIQDAGHELTVVLPAEPVYLQADLTRLAQVFSNLLTNSAKYTESGGHIWLTAEQQGNEVVLTVRDTGIGIPAEALPRVFDMFSQVDRSIERSAGGLGIGLALVKALVEKHHGSVSVASDGQGQGSTFTVRLPSLPAPESPVLGEPAGNETAAPAFRRVLVVDDNRDSRETLAMMLKLLGNEVFTASDGIAAVEAAAQFRPHMILMDVGMPKLNGHEATRRIRQQGHLPRASIFALTGWGQEEDRALSVAAGCDGHLVKPIDLAELKRVLTALDSEANARQNDAGHGPA